MIHYYIQLFRMPLYSGLANKMLAGVKGKKTQITYAFTMNADGSEKLPPFIIGEAMKPRAFWGKTGAQLGFYYRNNATAWMTSLLYQEWLIQWDKELQAKKRKILLLQDNFSGHIIPDGLQSVRVENFKANLTAHVQPADQGIIRTFKAHYRSKFMHCAISNYDCGVTPSEIYKINQLEAMRLADAAWREVDMTTIRHCWRKAGILPMTTATPASYCPTIPISSLLNAIGHTNEAQADSDPVARAEKEAQTAVDDLISTGALQHSNRMDLDTLLNPANESCTINETTDNEIFKAVVDARKALYQPITNGGDTDNNNHDASDARPSYRQMLEAVSVINAFSIEMDDPVARSLEAAVTSFVRRARSDHCRGMSSTLITDYFTSNRSN